MKHPKTLVMREGSNQIFALDTLSIEGGLWLVTNWYLSKDDKWIRPLRIISLDQLPYKKIEHEDAEYLLEIPIPTAVFDGPDPAKEGPPWLVKTKPEYMERTPDAEA